MRADRELNTEEQTLSVVVYAMRAAWVLFIICHEHMCWFHGFHVALYLKVVKLHLPRHVVRTWKASCDAHHYESSMGQQSWQKSICLFYAIPQGCLSMVSLKAFLQGDNSDSLETLQILSSDIKGRWAWEGGLKKWESSWWGDSKKRIARIWDSSSSFSYQLDSSEVSGPELTSELSHS